MPSGVLQIEGHAPLVAVEVLVVGSMARPAHGVADVERHRRLDHHRIGAPIGELAHGGRARAGPRQIQHADAVERQWIGRLTHGSQEMGATRPRACRIARDSRLEELPAPRVLDGCGDRPRPPAMMIEVREGPDRRQPPILDMRFDGPPMG